MRFESKFDVSKRYVIEVDGNFYPSTEFELHQMYLQIGKELGLLSDDATMPSEPAPCPHPDKHSLDLVVEGRIRTHEFDELRKEIEALKQTIAELRLQQPVIVQVPYSSPWGTPYPQQPWLGPWANTSSGLTIGEISVTVGYGVDVAKLAREVTEQVNLWRKGA